MAIRKLDRLKRTREALVARRRQLLGDLDRTTAEARQAAMQPLAGDAADRACSTSWLEQSYMLAEAEQEELAAIEEALQMIRDGQYGRCHVCGRRIAAARLRALPTAAFCVKCRMQQELVRERRVQLDTTGSLPLEADEDLMEHGKSAHTRKKIAELLSEEGVFFTEN